MIKTNKRWKILNKAFGSTVLTIALLNLASHGAGFIDSIITGHFLGSSALAAVGLASPLYSIVGVPSGLLGLGLQSCCAEEIGRGNHRKIQNIFSVVMIVAIVTALVLVTLAFLLNAPLARLFGARNNATELLGPTCTYLYGLSLGIPALLITPILAPMLQLDNDGKIVRVAAIITAVTDVVLDLAAVALNFGIIGIGLATTIAEYVNLLVLLCHFRKKERMLRFSFCISSMQLILRVIPKGLTNAVRRILKVVRPIIINNYIVMLAGSSSVAAMSIKTNVGAFAEILSLGIVSSISMVAGMAYGEKSKEDILQTGKLAHRYAIFGNAIVSVLIIVFAQFIADFYLGAGSDIRSLAIFALCVLAVELPLQTLIATRVAYLNVLSKIAEGQLLQVGLTLLAVIPSMIIMGNLFGIYGAFAGFVVGDVILLIIVYVVTAVRTKKNIVGVDGFLRLHNSFEINPGDVIELTVHNMNDAVLVSEQLHMFCLGHKLDRRKSYFSSLALEEIVYLIYENNDFSSYVVLDMRVIINDGKLIIRLRDNGKYVHPFGEIGPDEESEPFEHMGIKLLRKKAENIDYYNSMGINFTVVTI